MDPKDLKYLSNDPNFSPKRNQTIIQETIREAEKYHANQGKIIEESLGERVDILSTYARYRFNTGVKSFKDYVGKDLYNKLIGEKILSKIRVAETTNRLNGNTKFKKGILI